MSRIEGLGSEYQYPSPNPSPRPCFAAAPVAAVAMNSGNWLALPHSTSAELQPCRFCHAFEKRRRLPPHSKLLELLNAGQIMDMACGERA